MKKCEEKEHDFCQKPDTDGRAPGFMPNKACWPVMLTPFTQDNRIDWNAYDCLIDWYCASGVSGLFSVCLSSEFYQLTKEERLVLAQAAVRRVAGRIPVVAAAASDVFETDALVDAVYRMADTGVNAVVCLTNNFCSRESNDIVWRGRVEEFLSRVDSSIPLGIYEAPLPYKRYLTPELLGWLAQTGRFVMTKDTCCNQDVIRKKISHVQKTILRFYNADACTLLDSLQSGGNGFSGIAANFFPHLLSWMCANFKTQSDLALKLNGFFEAATPIIHRRYMQSAKFYLQRAGMPINTYTRLANHRFDALALEELDQLRRSVEEWEHILGIVNPFELMH